MRLVVDASVLVGELLRKAGRDRLADERLDLFIPELMWRETHHEIPRRVDALTRHRGLTKADAEQIVSACLEAIDANVGVIPEAVYAPLEDEARARSLRDPHDWPLVACALALGAAIWTHDNDLLGVGVATWTTETIRAWLDRNPLADAE